MTIILRLQGLDVTAGTEDIRAFFDSLHIPDGGVYIVGGSLREAFIGFNTERDAQFAMRLTGNVLKGSRVTLHISSMKELEHKLKSLLKRKKTSSTQPNVKRSKPSPDANLLPESACPLNPNTSNLSPTTAWPHDPNSTNLPQPPNPNIANLQLSNVQSMDSGTAFLLGICTVLQGLQSSHQTENKEAVPRVNTDSTVEVRTSEQTRNSKPGYVRLFGLPASTTKDDICQFFKGLTVQEAIVNIKLGHNHCCLVKFATMQDASDALLYNSKSLGPICVEVRGATEKLWIGALQECESGVDVEEHAKLKQSPLQETEKHKLNSTSALQIRRRPVKRLPSKSPKDPRLDIGSAAAISQTVEYIVMVTNLPKKMTKTEIKELFGCPNIAHRNVLHLLDKEGNRTDTAFLVFNCMEDYDYAMNLTGCHVGSDAIKVSSVTKKMMMDTMAKTRPWKFKCCLQTDKKKTPNLKRKPDPVETSGEALSMNPDQTAQKCLFVRNMPADVQKSQIESLFSKYKVTQDSITLLLDKDGKGGGEAVVQFKSPKLAELAQRLHGQDFLGTKVFLTKINVKQMEDILGRNV